MMTRRAVQSKLDKGKADLIALVGKCPAVIRLTFADGKLDPARGGLVSLPGDRGAVLIRLENGPGNDRFVNAQQNLSELRGEQAIATVRGVGPGVNWILISLAGVPALRTSLMVNFEIARDRTVNWPVDVASLDKAPTQSADP